MRFRAVATPLCLVLLGSTPPPPAPSNASASPSFSRARIVEASLRAHVEHLASDSLLGRDTAEPGGRMAAEYIAAAFDRYGLSPLPGHDGFLLPYTLYRAGFDPASTFIHVRGAREPMNGESGVDVRPFAFSDDGDVEAEVVFAGYGITAPELDYDDYTGLDVAGRLVLVLRHEPGENDPDSPFDGTSSTSHAFFTAKARNAEAHGAIGMILVTDPLNHEADEDLHTGGALSLEPRVPAPPDTTGAPFLAVHVSWTVARALVAGVDRSLEEIQRALDEGTLHASDVSLGAARARVAVQRLEVPEAVEALNVAGYLEGTDPGLRGEIVVVGGHHDHLGGTEGAGDTVYNGADDNASGTAGVLAIAEAFASSGTRPRRSVVFTTFSGEERGLLGSQAIVRGGQIPIERVCFMLNLDMIGRNPTHPLTIIGDGLSRGMRDVVERANTHADLELAYMDTGYAGNSDHDTFYRRDVPFIMFFTGLHPDYHQLFDHPDKLAYDRMARIVDLGGSLVDEFANMDGPPHIIHRIGWLGVEVEVLATDDDREARVTGVEAGSRGESAGFRVDDVLTGFGSTPLADPDSVGARFRDISPGTETTIEVRRGGGRHALPVVRARTGYLGVRPGDVDEDTRARLGLGPSEGVRIQQVVAGGPSDEAGVEANDILLSIDGRPVTTGTIGAVLSQIGAGEPVEIRLIRGGERLAMPLTLGERPRRN